jgi:hypothetical protein
MTSAMWRFQSNQPDRTGISAATIRTAATGETRRRAGMLNGGRHNATISGWDALPRISPTGTATLASSTRTESPGGLDRPSRSRRVATGRVARVTGSGGRPDARSTPLGPQYRIVAVPSWHDVVCRRRGDASSASARARRQHRRAGVVRAQRHRGTLERASLPEPFGAGRDVRSRGPLGVPEMNGHHREARSRRIEPVTILQEQRQEKDHLVRRRPKRDDDAPTSVTNAMCPRRARQHNTAALRVDRTCRNPAPHAHDEVAHRRAVMQRARTSPRPLCCARIGAG